MCWGWGSYGAKSALGVGCGLLGGCDDRAVFGGSCGRGGGNDASRIAAGGEMNQTDIDMIMNAQVAGS
jgi:hypothetical protein